MRAAPAEAETGEAEAQQRERAGLGHVARVVLHLRQRGRDALLATAVGTDDAARSVLTSLRGAGVPLMSASSVRVVSAMEHLQDVVDEGVAGEVATWGAASFVAKDDIRRWPPSPPAVSVPSPSLGSGWFTTMSGGRPSRASPAAESCLRERHASEGLDCLSHHQPCHRPPQPAWPDIVA